jgi:hypothetical protein
MKRARLLFAMVLGLFVTFAVLAPSASADGWITTGSSLRVKSIGPFTAKVYTITHMMKDKPKEVSKKGMIEAETDKQFLLFFQRDVDAEKIKNAFRESFKLNGYGDGGKIDQFLGAIGKGDVVEYDSKKKGPPSISISYNQASQTTTINVPDHGKASVQGADFMKAVWSIWFGKIDQPSMGDQLMASLPKG